VPFSNATHTCLTILSESCRTCRRLSAEEHFRGPSQILKKLIGCHVEIAPGRRFITGKNLKTSCDDDTLSKSFQILEQQKCSRRLMRAVFTCHNKVGHMC
jgi:GTP-sensing pleiotropic transcriptional regulator CodY